MSHLSPMKQEDQQPQQKQETQGSGKYSHLFEGAFMRANQYQREEILAIIQDHPEWVDTPQLRDRIAAHYLSMG